MDAVTNATSAAAYTSYGSNAKKAEDKAEKKENEAAATPAATVEISGKSSQYPKIDREAVNRILEQTKTQNEAFVEMIRKLFLKQGGAGGGAAGFKFPDNNIKEFIMGLAPDQETIDKAQEAISEDGYYGVKKTSERIMAFAVAIAGDDPAALESMRKAVQQGFGAAEKAWGDKLPDICQRTYDACMSKFDELTKAAADKAAAKDEGNKADEKKPASAA